MFSDAGYPIRDLDARQAAAGREGFLSNAGDAVWDPDASETVAP